jgi:hypothetical protein
MNPVRRLLELVELEPKERKKRPPLLSSTIARSRRRG